MEYDFILRFDTARISLAPEEIVELLGERGCDDATIGTGVSGRTALAFTREADSADEAVTGALDDVLAALPRATLVEASPDYVGLTDIAKVVGRSRQNLRKLLVDCSADAPLPVHEGTSSIWHLAPVLEWLQDSKGYSIDAGTLEIARCNMQLNAALARIPVSPLIAEHLEEHEGEVLARSARTLSFRDNAEEGPRT